jgi:hypothetical protein
MIDEKEMKKITMILLALISEVSLINAQAPNWQWANSSGETYDETAYSVATYISVVLPLPLDPIT